MYIYIYQCTDTYIHMFIYVHNCTYKYTTLATTTRAGIAYIFINVYLRLYIHTYLFTYICIYMYMYIYIYIYIHIQHRQAKSMEAFSVFIKDIFLSLNVTNSGSCFKAIRISNVTNSFESFFLYMSTNTWSGLRTHKSLEADYELTKYKARPHKLKCYKIISQITKTPIVLQYVTNSRLKAQRLKTSRIQMSQNLFMW